MLRSLSLRLRIFLFFAALALGALALLVLGLAFGYRHAGTPESAPGFVQAGALAGFAILGLVAWVWFLFDANVAKPIDQLSGALRARAHGGVDAQLDTAIARYLGDLAPAAAAAAASLAETRSALTESVARETARLTGEKARLEALLADVPLGVLLCSADHQLVFYNGQALDLLRAGEAAGLARTLLDYLHQGPLLHAYSRLLATGDAEAASDLLCTTKRDLQMLAARMRLLAFDGDSTRPGYVLTLRDVTADLNAIAQRELLMAEVFARLRRPIANLATLLDVLPQGEPLPARADIALRQEATALSAALSDLMASNEAQRSEHWPLAITRGSDLIDGLVARLQTEGLTITHAEPPPILLHCNGFEIVGLINTIARDLDQPLHLTLTEDDSDAMLRLEWAGAPLGLATLDNWLTRPIDPATPDLSARVVLTRHATDIWPETHGPRHSLCLPLQMARRSGNRPKPVARAVVYDFDLLSKARNDKVAEQRLKDLTYVVFDTETTGLLPDQGDEIVQIAAVRIVNGRRLQSEVFDTLVNPRRSIPASSTAVHGITGAMVADAPEITDVARRFHAFAAGAVLIAHNAPFDMEFLRRTEAATGLLFDNPILDTVLLSAVVYGQHETHSLDALTYRLGITIAEEARHTALGDTVATADAFLKLLPMLQGLGFDTFGAVLTEVRRHGRLLKDLN
ncbi:MAG: exonuclease domain-containing protein [Cypionkella sp.]